MIVISSFISPYREDRAKARAVAPEMFHDVYIKATVEACEKRDTKGLYKQARAGKISEFTGISAPYEEPENPDVVVDTEHADVKACVDNLLTYVERQFVEPVKNMAIEDGNDYTGTGI
jgi:adenylylsulfate kinase-like enzyme